MRFPKIPKVSSLINKALLGHFRDGNILNVFYSHPICRGNWTKPKPSAPGLPLPTAPPCCDAGRPLLSLQGSSPGPQSPEWPGLLSCSSGCLFLSFLFAASAPFLLCVFLLTISEAFKNSCQAESGRLLIFFLFPLFTLLFLLFLSCHF